MALTREDANATAAKLEAFLPESIGEFKAQGPAVRRVHAPTWVIRVEREYVSGPRKLTVELATGNVRMEMRVIAEDAEHAFGSDSPTYWRTVDIRGRRARIAEERGSLSTSTVYVRVGPSVAAKLMVAPRNVDGESETLAAKLDLDGIERAGVTAPEEPERHGE